MLLAHESELLLMLCKFRRQLSFELKLDLQIITSSTLGLSYSPGLAVSNS